MRGCGETRMKPLLFEGVFPILATPFDDNENLDLESFDDFRNATPPEWPGQCHE